MDISNLTTKNLSFEQVDILSSLKTTNDSSNDILNDNVNNLLTDTKEENNNIAFNSIEKSSDQSSINLLQNQVSIPPQTQQIQIQKQTQQISTENNNISESHSVLTSSPISSLQPMNNDGGKAGVPSPPMDFQTLQQLISGLQTASFSGDTKIRSIDMINPPTKYSLDQQSHSPFVIPNLQNQNQQLQYNQNNSQTYSYQPMQSPESQNGSNNNINNVYYSPEQLALSQHPLPPPERILPHLTSPPVDRLEMNEALLSRQRNQQLEQQENFENMMAKQTQVLKKKDTINFIYDEIQLPLFVGILFFIFQLPFFKSTLYTYFPFFFYDEKTFTLHGYLVSSFLFAVIYYLFYRLSNYVLFQK